MYKVRDYDVAHCREKVDSLHFICRIPSKKVDSYILIWYRHTNERHSGIIATTGLPRLDRTIHTLAGSKHTAKKTADASSAKKRSKRLDQASTSTASEPAPMTSAENTIASWQPDHCSCYPFKPCSQLYCPNAQSTLAPDPDQIWPLKPLVRLLQCPPVHDQSCQPEIDPENEEDCAFLDDEVDENDPLFYRRLNVELEQNRRQELRQRREERADGEDMLLGEAKTSDNKLLNEQASALTSSLKRMSASRLKASSCMSGLMG